MQDITAPLGINAQLIQSYGAGGFRIGNAEYTTHVLVLPEKTISWNGEWTLDALAPILSHQPRTEFIFIGTGARHELLDINFRRAIQMADIALDTMDTGAACRTFNVLLAEGRRVAAALRLPV